MSTLKVSNIENPSTTSGGIDIDTSGHVTVDGVAYPSAGSLSGRNRIINGSMDVSQRGVAFSNIDGYCLDRWYVNRAGGVSGLTAAQAYGAFSSKKNWMSLQRDSGNTSTASAAIYQPIEGINCRDLAGTTVTISFTLGTGGTLSSTSNNVVINLFYQTTSTDIGVTGSWTLINSTSFSVASNTGPTRYTASFSVPSTATQLLPTLGIAFAGTAGADDRYYITDFQLEAGTVATPFERRSYGQELSLCQRYYQLMTSFSNSFNAPGTSESGFFNYEFKVPMRQAPTVTITSTGTTSRLSSLNVTTTGIDTVSLQAVSSSSGMVYVYGLTAANASAEL